MYINNHINQHMQQFTVFHLVFLSKITWGNIYQILFPYSLFRRWNIKMSYFQWDWFKWLRTFPLVYCVVNLIFKDTYTILVCWRWSVKSVTRTGNLLLLISSLILRCFSKTFSFIVICINRNYYDLDVLSVKIHGFPIKIS
jgi:hypothetical protein